MTSNCNLVKCAYCGALFQRYYRTVKYCSDKCRKYARQDQKAKYQRKRRKLMNNGYLISNENNYTGTGFLSNHKQDNIIKERAMIDKELQRLGLK